MIIRILFSSAAVGSAALLTPTSAFAEVCDKITDRWNPADGPITIYQEAINLGPLGVFLVGSAALSIFLRRAWIGYVAAAAGLGFATLSFLHGDMGEIGDYAVREGCKTGHPTQAWVLAIMGLIGLAAAWHASKTRKAK